MTTREAEAAYAVDHLLKWHGKPLVVHNPNNKPLDELPVIYGFNNGGEPGWFNGTLLADDGTGLGGHACSDECYMPHDLGCLEGSRPDRHKGFQEHYPDGYRMEFVPMDDVRGHAGLMQAYERNQAKRLANNQ